MTVIRQGSVWSGQGLTSKVKATAASEWNFCVVIIIVVIIVIIIIVIIIASSSSSSLSGGEENDEECEDDDEDLLNGILPRTYLLSFNLNISLWHLL